MYCSIFVTGVEQLFICHKVFQNLTPDKPVGSTLSFFNPHRGADGKLIFYSMETLVLANDEQVIKQWNTSLNGELVVTDKRIIVVRKYKGGLMEREEIDLKSVKSFKSGFGKSFRWGRLILAIILLFLGVSFMNQPSEWSMSIGVIIIGISIWLLCTVVLRGFYLVISTEGSIGTSPINVKLSYFPSKKYEETVVKDIMNTLGKLIVDLK